MANRTQLQTALQKPYDRILFAKEVLSPVFGAGFSLSSSLVLASVQPNKTEQTVIDTVSIYGNIILEDNTEITCYEIVLQPTVRIEQSKVAIQRYVRKLLTAGQAALVNFVAPQNKNVWRLTLVAKDSEIIDGSIKEKTTHAKRYTYLLGPNETCKTAAERFETLSTERQINFEALINAFSVEKLSKAFFDEYTLHYENFCDYLQSSNYRKTVFNISFPSNATKEEKDKACKSIRDFTKKLLGRIVFLYFVQKKGWLGASNKEYKDGDINFMMNLFKKSGTDETFYPRWLTVLFFETLNKERSGDISPSPLGKAGVGLIPFLNGGLFDKEEHDRHLLTFKAKLFHNLDNEDIILTKNNSANSRGFLDFLNSYNFTVHEDSPDDHTIAVDPEMLSHIFENLLENNKDKGTFYTPKEIVHYMCQESLIEYLSTKLSIIETASYQQLGKEQTEMFTPPIKKNQLKLVVEHKIPATNITRADVEQLIKYKEITKATEPHLQRIDSLLDAIKTCDPAIGSGAYPMGLLLEIFAIKEVIAYELGNTWKPAEVKENIIQNSIYGVDIEKGAVEIARLRFWLSLVVDEDKPRALPNLDYKIVVGDSLLPKFEDEVIDIDWDLKDVMNKEAQSLIVKIKSGLTNIVEKQKQFFKTKINKPKLQIEIRNLKIDLLINQLTFDKLKYQAKNNEQVKLSFHEKTKEEINKDLEIKEKINGYLHTIKKLEGLKKRTNEPLQFFDWKLDFPEIMNPAIAGENYGFDIVVGNPPYITLALGKKQKIFTDEQIEAYKNIFNEVFEYKGNSFAFFIAVGRKLLNKSGVLSYIIPNTLLLNSTFGKLRSYLLNKSKLLYLIDLRFKVFDAAETGGNLILGFSTPNKTERKTRCVTLEQLDFSGIEKITELKLQSEFEKNDEFKFRFSQDESFGFLERLNENSIILDKIVTFYQGIITGDNPRFLSKKKLNSKYKPILRGKDIDKFAYTFGENYVLFDKKLLWSNTNEELFSAKEKLINRQTGDTLTAAYDNRQYFTLDSTHIQVLKNTAFNLKYVLSIFNSQLMQLWYKETVNEMGRTFAQVKIIYLRKIPIKNILKSEQNAFIEIVDKILSAKEKNPQADTSALEKQIDNLVYKLYNLTYDEIKLIDPDFGLSEAEYEKIEL